jgi:hypothetical protein
VETASLIKLIETPPPTLLRVRFDTALFYLPSVPSVVLSQWELNRNRLGSPTFKQNVICKQTKLGILSNLKKRAVQSNFQLTAQKFFVKIAE